VLLHPARRARARRPRGRALCRRGEEEEGDRRRGREGGLGCDGAPRAGRGRRGGEGGLGPVPGRRVLAEPVAARREEVIAGRRPSSSSCSVHRPSPTTPIGKR
jgi:hypothetical protein